MENMLKMTDVYKEIIQLKGWDVPDYKGRDHMAVLRKKYRFLIANLLYRNTKSYKGSISEHYVNYVPTKDAPIVRELLIRATDGPGKDSTCCKWMNGSLGCDYHKIATLYSSLCTFLNNLLDSQAITRPRYQAWKEAINASLCGETAIKIEYMNRLLDDWFIETRAMNPYFLSDSSQAEAIKDSPSFTVMNVREETDLDSESIPQLFEHLHQQHDYPQLLSDIICKMQNDSIIKTEKLICMVLNLRQSKPLDIDSYSELLPNGWLIYAQEAYHFLKAHPDSCQRVAQSTGVENPIEYFKLLEDETERFKNDEKMKAEDTDFPLPLDKYFK